MSIRNRLPSPVHPRKPVDQTEHKQSRALVEDSIAAGYCAAPHTRRAHIVDRLRRQRGGIRAEWPARSFVVERCGTSGDLPSHHLAPTFSRSQVVKPPRFNAHYDIEDVDPVDGATWKLELAGLIKDKRPWTAQQIYQLPEQ